MVRVRGRYGGEEDRRKHDCTCFTLQNSTATVTVRVMDANDNTPVIPDQKLTFEAKRNPGDVITTIKVTLSS